jgi:hypothetical protein
MLLIPFPRFQDLSVTEWHELFLKGEIVSFYNL